MKKLLTGIASIFLAIQSFAQTPDMYPPPDPVPVEPTTLNIVLYIVLPLLLIIGFLLYSRWTKKGKNKKEENR